ncbi:MAG TPA: hypothetical protein VGN84_03755 [Solirubrobacterales bacterium]|jgi:hypothetical protein|nr:hypothetical protein [Solirubrobacterales bacterium]
MPFWQGVIGVGLVAALFLAASGEAPFWGGGPTWQLGFFYVLAFGGTILGCVAARASRGPLGWLQDLLVAQVYARPYSLELAAAVAAGRLVEDGARTAWRREEPPNAPAIVT